MSQVTNPIWSHELRLARRRWVRWFGQRHAGWYAALFAVCYVALVTALWLGQCRAVPGRVVELLLVAVTILAPGMAAVSLAGERQRGSWTLLVTSPLSPQELIFGKFAGRALGLAALCLPLLPVDLVLELPIRPLADVATELGIGTLVLGATILGLTGLGLTCSARCRTVTAALLWAYALTAGLAVGVPLLSGLTHWSGALDTLTSPVLLYDSTAPERARETLPCVACYLLLAWAGVALPVIEFEGLLRLDGEPRQSGLRQLWVSVERARRQAARQLRRVWTTPAGRLATCALLGASGGLTWWLAGHDPRWLVRDVLLVLLGCALLLALVVPTLVPAVPPRLAARLHTRLATPWHALVVGRWLVSAALAALLYLPLAVPVLVKAAVGWQPVWLVVAQTAVLVVPSLLWFGTAAALALEPARWRCRLEAALLPVLGTVLWWQRWEGQCSQLDGLLGTHSGFWFQLASTRDRGLRPCCWHSGTAGAWWSVLAGSPYMLCVTLLTGVLLLGAMMPRPARVAGQTR